MLYPLPLTHTRILLFYPHLLLFQTFLVRLLHCRYRFPWPFQINTRLLPPPHPHPWPLYPLRRLTEAHKWLRSNVMHNRIMTLPNIRLHRLKPRLHPLRLCRGLLPLPVWPPPWEPPFQLKRHLVLENSQELSHAGVTTHVSTPKSSNDWTKAL